MKKKILGVTVVLFVAIFTAFNVNINTQNGDTYLLTLANVEALTQGESNPPVNLSCFESKNSGLSMFEMNCGTCSYNYFKPGSSSTCKAKTN